MTCYWCKQGIEYEDCRRPCPRWKGRRLHRPDNRHAPSGDPCVCRRSAAAHRVPHDPEGDPCARKDCGLPAASHVPQRIRHPPATYRALRERDGWRCQLCGEAFLDPAPKRPDPRSVTVDHVVAVIAGGTDELSNLRLAHAVCNLRRSNAEQDARAFEAVRNGTATPHQQRRALASMVLRRSKRARE
jgi:5-methylcytosine-specific restriction endonuclease McrA